MHTLVMWNPFSSTIENLFCLLHIPPTIEYPIGPDLIDGLDVFVGLQRSLLNK